MKKITHVFAVIGGLAIAFVATPAGQALVHQYPVLSVIVTLGTTIAALYHSPKA